MKENLFDSFKKDILSNFLIIIPIFLYPLLFSTLFLLVDLYEVPNRTLFRWILLITFVLLPINPTRTVNSWIEKNKIEGLKKMLVRGLIILIIWVIAILLQLFLWNIVFIGILGIDLMVISVKYAFIYLTGLTAWRAAFIF